MPTKRRTRRAERRRMDRADARLSMRLDAAREDAARARVVTETQNISASGVYCRSSHYLAPLSKVDLTIVLPKLPGARGAKELIKCEGIVVRCEPSTSRKAEKGFELACMFSDLDERRKARLDEFVTWRNLQALRAAAGLNGTSRAPRAGNGAARATPATRRPAGARTAVKRAAKTTTRKRRTVH